MTAGGSHPRHRCLHGSRAGARQGRGQTCGHLGFRLRCLRGADESSPFPGETVTDVIAAVVKNEPDWTALPAATPPRHRRPGWCGACRKDPRARLRDIGDARLEIAEAGRRRRNCSTPTSVTAAGSRRGSSLTALARTRRRWRGGRAVASTRRRRGSATELVERALVGGPGEPVCSQSFHRTDSSSRFKPSSTARRRSAS